MWQFRGLVFVLFVTVARSQPDSIGILPTDTLTDTGLPQFDVTGDEGESGAGQQDISGLLQGSRDVFVQFASFQFGPAGFRIRGLESDQHLVLINGVDLSDPETGRSSWSTWGGLNEVTRQVETRTGNTPCPAGFPGLGGYTNISAAAGNLKRQSRIGYTHSGRVFRHRLMLIHSTGLTRAGWAFSAAASIRHGNAVTIPGTYFSSGSVFLSAHRRLNRHHALSATAFAAPVEQGRQNALLRETFLLTKDPYYNSAWGLQNGKARNSSIGRNFLPTAMFSHRYVPGRDLTIVTTICYQRGRTGFTGLNYADAANPRPDYYRNLPSASYHTGDTVAGLELEAAWHDDFGTRQIRWDEMVALNRSNLFSLPSDSTAPVNTTETRALYLLENRVKDRSLLLLNSVFLKHHKRLIWTGGLSGKICRTRNYKIAEDLLGASFWLDVDPFATGAGMDGQARQNDLAHPDRKVRTGERFGYDYSLHTTRTQAWTQLEYKGRHVDLFMAGDLSLVKCFRIGHFTNGKFPSSSHGRSEDVSLPGAGIRTGSVCKISGRQYLTATIAFIIKQPATSDIFVSPAVRNQIVTMLKPERQTAADLTYHLHIPGARLRATVYHAAIKDQIWTRTFWHDGYGAMVNMVMSSTQVNYQGFEFGCEKSAGRHLIQSAAGYAAALYRGRPMLEAWQDNNSMNIYNGRPAYLNNYRANSSPQLALGICYRYSGRRSWFVSAAVSHLAQIHTNLNPERRTREATAKFGEDEMALAAKITGQEKIPSWWLSNLGFYKAFRLRNRSVVGCSMHVNNVLDVRTIYSGFEQLRWDATNPELFAPKYYFSSPRTVLMSLTYNF